MNTPLARHRTATVPASVSPYGELAYLDADGLTDRGNVRSNNEDQFLVADLMRDLVVQRSSVSLVSPSITEPQAKLLAVADGIGGHTAGELASAVAIETVARHLLVSAPWFWREDKIHDSDVVHDLEETVSECEHYLRDVTRGYPAEEAPGTTLTLAYVSGWRVYVLHVGDSRCYLQRNGRLFQLTNDHTLAREVQKQRPGDQISNSLGHILVNAIGGTDERVYGEVRRVNMKPGDSLLLCTDGLTNELDPTTLNDLLARSGSATNACKVLIEAAKQREARDNVTAVVCRFD